MKMTPANRRAFVRRSSRQILASSILALSAPLLHAATFTWLDTNTGVLNWSAGAWTPAIPTALDSLITTDLIFNGSGATQYTANNDLANPFLLNTLTLNSTATVVETIGGSGLSFNADDAPAAITQSGSGAFAISAPITATTALTLGGTGAGLVTLSGVVGGGGGLNFTGGNWLLSNLANSYTGGTTIGAGAFVEISPAGAAPQSINITPAATGLLGGNGAANALTINGGTLKLTTKGAGNLTLAVARVVTFGASGGTLDLTNTNAPGVQGGNIAGGDLALTLNSTAGNPAVIKFNGGQLGLSNNSATDGNWVLGTNALRVSTLTGSATTPVRFELTNGALMRGSVATGAVDNNYAMPITIRGVIGGDPTSGAAGTLNTGLGLITGRVQYDNNRANYNGGLTIEGAVQFNNANRATAINGSITVASNGYAAFQGRGTGQTLNSTIAAVGTTAGPANLVLYIGENSSTTLTVQSGGIADFDGRIRIEQAFAHGILMGGNAVLNAGGTLRLQQSTSNFSATTSLTTNMNVSDVILRGNITGQGTTANESLLEIKLPAPDAAGTIANGVPVPLSGTALVSGSGARPFAGLVAEAAHALIVNGSGFGGLRVLASSRPDRLFSVTGVAGGAAMPDPTPNTTKLNSYLTATRLAALTGTGGYLSPGANGGTWNFPAGGEWANGVTVGLRTIDSNTGGTDLSLAAVSVFNHHVAVDAGAALDTGAGAFTFGSTQAVTINGRGTISGAGGITVAAGSTLAPGFSIGTLSVGNITLNGTFQYEATSAPTSDLLVVGGNITLGAASTLSLPGGNTYATADYTLVTYTGTRTGTFGTVPALPAGFVLDYGTGTNSTIRLTYSTPTDVWDGTISGVWNTTAANWKTLAPFVNLHKVLIDDNAAGPNTNIVINAGDVTPFSVTVNNSTIANYSITGSAGNAIVGSGTLTKNGTGTLTLAGPHAYGGGTNVNNGTLRLGANDSLPNVGAVAVAAGAVLDVNGKTDTIGALSVDGSVTAGNLTTGALALGSGASVAANLTLGGDVTKSATGAATVSGSINLNGPRTFTVPSDTAPELTVSGAISNGALTKAGNGTLKIGTGGSLAAGTALTLNGGTLDGGDTALSLSSLTGVAGTTLGLGSGSLALAQTTNTIFAGDIKGAASVTKTLAGRITLSGVGSDYSGGLFVNGGTVIATSVNAPGTGTTTVNPTGTFQVGANLTIPITLQGGTLATQGSPAQITNNTLTAADGTTSTILIADSTNLASNSEAILLGANGILRGGGNINIQAGTANGAPDGGPGFRLRGTGASDFGGIVTAGPSTKFEIQINNAASPNPLGAGKVVLTAGTRLGNLNGTYSQFQTRINGAGENVIFGNDFTITGTGYVNYNALGGANVTANFNNLKIGGGQIFGFNKNDTTSRTVIFDSVTLTGGNAEFRLFDPGFSNSATPGGANLMLGVIGGIAGSGVIFNGQAPYVTTITGDSNYSGTTTVSTGTLQVGTGGTTGSLGAGAVTDNALIVFNRSDTLSVPNSITGTGTVTNAGGAANVLELTGAQDYATLNANSGATHLHGSFTAGTATVNVLANLGIATSQTIGALNIFDGGVVTVDSALSAPPPAPGLGDGGIGDFGISQNEVQAVPEPGALSLLVLGAMGMLARRSK